MALSNEDYWNQFIASKTQKKTTSTVKSTPTSTKTTSKPSSSSSYNFYKSPEQNAINDLKKLSTPSSSNLTQSFFSSNRGQNFNDTAKAIANVVAPSAQPTPKPIDTNMEQLKLLQEQNRQLQQQLQQQPQGLDYNKIQDMVTQSLTREMPKYQSPYQSQIMDTLSKIQNYQAQPYNPQSDAALKVAQQQAIDKVRQDMARRGRVFDTYAASQEQQVAQGLIPDYYRLGLQQEQQQRSDLYNQLGALQGLEQTGYGRYQDQYGQQRQAEQDYLKEAITRANLTGQFDGTPTVSEQDRQRNIQLQETQRAEQQEIADFGTVLSPQMRQYRQTYLSMPQDIKRQLLPLGQQDGGFATTINRLLASDPSNPLLPYLQALRANKILSDPEMMAQYGAEYGLQTGAITQMAESEQQQDIVNRLEQIKLQTQNQKYVEEITKVQAEVRKIESEKAYKDTETIKKEYEALQEQLKYKNLPTKLKAELESELQLAEQRAASAQSSIASAKKSISDIDVNQARKGLIQKQQVTEAERAKTERERTESQKATTLLTQANEQEVFRNIASKDIDVLEKEAERIGEESDFIINAYNDITSKEYGGNLDAWIMDKGAALNNRQFKALTDAIYKINRAKKSAGEKEDVEMDIEELQNLK
jgi:hypothetical protein